MFCYFIQMYEDLCRRLTPNGVTLDKCIQPSVDYTGKIIGLVAGDEECYEVCNPVCNGWQMTHDVHFRFITPMSEHLHGMYYIIISYMKQVYVYLI